MSNLGLSNPTSSTLELGKNIALRMNHLTMGTEHVFLAMLQSPYIRKIMDHCNVDTDALYDSVFERAQEENVSVQNHPQLERISLDPSTTEVLDRAATMARASARTHVVLSDLLVAISKSTTRKWLSDILDAHRLDSHAIISALTRTAVDQEPESAPQVSALTEKATAGDAPATTARPANRLRAQELGKYSVCLTALARSGQLDPVVGRSHEIERVVQTLARRRKNNPLLVGEPGVGKTAIAEGLAQRIVNGEVPEKLRHLRVYALSLSSLVAGTKYRGDFEARITAILNEAKADPNIVLMIDEIHTLVGAGSAGGGTMDAANLFKPALAAGALRVIGATTHDEYRQTFSKDRALSRRFQKVDVAEPTKEESLAILKGLLPGLEKHHAVAYEPAALEAALTLSIRHLPERLLPDKAIDVLDEAGARAHLNPASTGVVDVATVEAVVAQIAQVPVGQISSTDRERLRHLESDLRGVIFGQDDAISVLVKAVKLARAGIRQGERPVASLMFAGPTGVGKTELTAQLAEKLNLKLLRFDMSEYMEAHAVSRLVGAPPGYLGHETGGLLTEAVGRAPHAVVLLDEIEKAHPSINNLLLQVMDHGRLTDTHGRVVDFRNVVLVLTTNAGAAIAARRTLGFVAQDHQSDAKESIRHSFQPEFRNRLDAIVNFKPLGQLEIVRVVDKMLAELSASLQAKQIELGVSDDAKHWLAEHGHDPEQGARPMRRLIEDTLHGPLADAVLFGELESGGRADFVLQDGQVIGQFFRPVAPLNVAEGELIEA